MVSSSGDGGLFRTSFLEPGLVTFAECVKHYDAFDADALMDEMRLLLTPPMLAVPFGLSSSRYYALMDALIQCAGTNRDLSAERRTKLVAVCIDIGMFLRNRTAEGRAAAFETALTTALEDVRAARVHPEVAHQIERALHGEIEPAAGGEAKADTMRALDFEEPPPALALALSA